MSAEHKTLPFAQGATMTCHLPVASPVPSLAGSGQPRCLDPRDPMQTARQLLADGFDLDGQQTLYRHRQGFFKFSASSYRPVDDETIRTEIWEYLDSAVKLEAGAYNRFKPTKTRVEDVFAALSSLCNLDGMVVPPVWLDEDIARAPADEFVPVANGLLHLPSGKLFPPSPNYFAVGGSAVAFDVRAPQPTNWLKFLHDTFGDDRLSIDLLQEWMGYCLSANTSQHKIMLLVGPPRSGKSTIASLMTALLGSSNVVAMSMASLSETFGLESLIGKKLAISGDARIGGRADQSSIVERLLGISGEDTQIINRKFRHAWSGRLPTRLMMLSNELPRLADNSGALAKRFLVLQTVRSFYGEEDHTLEARLRAEMPGILNWAMDGYRRLRDRGRFVQPESAAQAIREVEELASPIKAFVAEKCGLDGEVPINELYGAYVPWCKDNGHEAASKLTFGRNLKAAVPGLKQSQHRNGDDRQRIYVGISLKPGWKS